jgi:alkaline phosphatase D
MTHFNLGVSAGDVKNTTGMFWTKIHNPVQNVNCTLFLATNSNMQNIVQTKVVPATYITEANNFTLKTQLNNLLPNTVYYYQFSYNNEFSDIGRIKTLGNNEAKFLLLTCNKYETVEQFFDPDLITEEFDFIVHNGDFIYEDCQPNIRTIVLPSGQQFAESLTDYRFLYETYRSDENMRKLLKKGQLYHIFDDHEIANDWYYDSAIGSGNSPSHHFRDNPTLLTQLYLDAKKAMMEYIPNSLVNTNSQFYRAFDLSFALMVFVDTRSFRSPHPCGVEYKERMYTPFCPQMQSPNQLMLGTTQMNWLKNQIINSPYNLIYLVSPSCFTDILVPSPEGESWYLKTDIWSGYQYQRNTIIQLCKQYGKKLVVLSGDLHASLFANGIDYVEVMTPAMSSKTVGEELFSYVGLTPENHEAIVKLRNPRIQHFNGYKKGYTIVHTSNEFFRVKIFDVNHELYFETEVTL